MASNSSKLKTKDKPAEWAWEHQAEIYKERDILVALLARAYPSHIRQHPHSPKSHRAVICIHVPVIGQLAWSVPDDLLDTLYRGRCEWAEQDSDRATTKQKHERIMDYITHTRCSFPSDAQRLRKTT